MKHITQREAIASVESAKALMDHFREGDTVHLETDAVATAHAWRKGTKNKALNKIVKETAASMAHRGIFITARHIPGVTNTRADWLSRNPDPKNYRLRRDMFKKVCRHFRARPLVDMFASSQNKQLEKYCSWRRDPWSLGDAFQQDWSQWKMVWANPPWELAGRMLDKIKTDKACALVCLPLWRAATWWRTLMELQAAPLLVSRGQSLYRDPEGNKLPSPRWATLFTVCRG